MLGNEVKLLDTATGQFQPDALPGKHSFGGIVWSKDGRTLYLSGKAQDGAVLVTRFDENGHATDLKPIAFDLNSRIEPTAAPRTPNPAAWRSARMRRRSTYRCSTTGRWRRSI